VGKKKLNTAKELHGDLMNARIFGWRHKQKAASREVSNIFLPYQKKNAWFNQMSYCQVMLPAFNINRQAAIPHRN